MSSTTIRVRVLPQILPTDGREIELQATPTFIQWRYVTDINGEYTWSDLIAIADLVGPEGPAVEMRSDGTNIQYRPVGGDEGDWVNVVPLLDIQGPVGPQGVQGIQGPVGPQGAGDFVGPASSTLNAFVGFADTTGKLGKQLTATQATANLNAVVGDTGSGGTKGLVPAPASGDAAAGKFLAADGAWAAPSSSGIPTQGRLSLTSGVSVPESDVVGATSVYLVPDGLNLQPIYDGALWNNRPLAQMTLSLNATAHPDGKLYDAFVAWQGGAMIIGTGPDWVAGAVTGSITARGTGAGSTEIELFEGRWVNKNAIVLKNGATTYSSVPARQATLVGGFGTSGAGMAVDSFAKRYVWSVNAVLRRCRGPDPVAASWVYSTATWRMAGGLTTNFFGFIQGLGGRPVKARATSFTSSLATAFVLTGVGVDSTTVNSARDGIFIGSATTAGVALSSEYNGYLTIGAHAINWLEQGGGSSTQTWYGPNNYSGPNFPFAAGISGEVWL